MNDPDPAETPQIITPSEDPSPANNPDPDDTSEEPDAAPDDIRLPPPPGESPRVL